MELEGIDRDLQIAADRLIQVLQPAWQALDQVAFANQARVQRAFLRYRVSQADFIATTGYGYGDQGRDKLEKIWAEVFGGEAALVRPQIVSGTHAITVGLFGCLRPGDELLSLTGTPYDTLQSVIGHSRGVRGSLKEWGVEYRQIELNREGRVDLAAVSAAIDRKTRVVFIQRSRGYEWRPSLSIEELRLLIRVVKETNPNVICLVDNCYGEFVEPWEPGFAGADLVAGSLIKNPGGGLAPGGGYLVGRQDLIELAASRLTAPGVGAEIGPSLVSKQPLYQGLFLAPHITAEALKGAIFTAAFFKELGYEVDPLPEARRSDIIQAIRFGTPEKLVAFIRSLQKFSPVDSFARPDPSPMPGYEHEVIMAAGTFVQGSSIELSADAPLRSPFIAYVQGGFSKEQTIISMLNVAQDMRRLGVL